MMNPCGHESQIADKFKDVVMADGHVEHIRLPQTFVALKNPVYCRICGQLVDADDSPYRDSPEEP